MTPFNAPLTLIRIFVVVITTQTKFLSLNCGNAAPPASCGAPETLNNGCGNMRKHFGTIIAFQGRLTSIFCLINVKNLNWFNRVQGEQLHRHPRIPRGNQGWIVRKPEFQHGLQTDCGRQVWHGGT